LQADSANVSSNQAHTHPKLPALLHRHASSDHRKPIAAHNQRAFDQLLAQLAKDSRPIVLDSFCGTGHSTALLAQRHPNHLIVGIDKSAHRLAKHPNEESDNYLLLQAECEDIWSLLLKAGLYPDYHYILYPNPWPKSGHLQRRVHGNPAFVYLLRLGGQIELRSNWQIYVEEFGLAMTLSGHPGIVRRPQPATPITLFERKYQSSGHTLWAFEGHIKRAKPAQ
jgi:tRNA (guanine-N7-)-methyltransferase